LMAAMRMVAKLRTASFSYRLARSLGAPVRPCARARLCGLACGFAGLRVALRLRLSAVEAVCGSPERRWLCDDRLAARRPGADGCPPELRRVTTMSLEKKILLDSRHSLDNKNCR
jgi:hypothetical protein